ncbi:DAL5-Allantoate and ureidosuccinate permease [Fusarium tjaetaba]|uniref:DAL5-Allantoate and ureidosuccinate permease n=1 Tax=Fusarium tjaetaba TaxID=1567544 RepID=A0A8H5RYQ4_9HYPO|nr:DAL5-Allantoate and ureidosuccinate permease [Fusarium tjaetaba]KAF5643346.1 DAL5-Allantoate and ureidosuccinate permease [Fusarium tjaetaba]
MSSPPSSDIPWLFNGKSAIATGGSRGIGQAISIHLARKGLSNLAITYASKIEATEETLKRCQELGVEQRIAIKADALDPRSSVCDPTVAYGASKTALQSYTRAFAENFSKSKKATFSSVIVDLTATDSIKASQHMMPPDFLDGQIRDTTTGERIGVPGDIAYIVSFVAS